MYILYIYRKEPTDEKRKGNEIMDLVIIIGFGLFLLSAILYTIGWMVNKWEFVPKFTFDYKNYSKRVRVEWEAGLYFEVVFCTVVKHYKVEFTWGW